MLAATENEKWLTEKRVIRYKQKNTNNWWEKDVALFIKPRLIHLLNSSQCFTDLAEKVSGFREKGNFGFMGDM